MRYHLVQSKIIRILSNMGICLFLMTLVFPKGYAADVTISVGKGRLSGNQGTLALHVENMVPVGGLQFDLIDEGNPLVIDSVTPGPGLQGQEIRHRELDSGILRILVFPEIGTLPGPHAIPADSGRLLNLYYSRETVVEADTVAIHVENILAADTTGSALSAEAEDGRLFPTGVKSIPGHVPRRVRLQQNYPNPFNATTVIPFSIPSRSRVELHILDLEGQLVRVLHSGPLREGDHRFLWHGLDRRGIPVASGIYFYRIRVKGEQQYRKLLLMK